MNPNMPRAGPHDATSRGSGSFGRPVLICLLLGLITVAAFWPVRHFDFIDYDDQEYVTENAQVRAGLTWEGVAWAFGKATAANWHPLTWLSHMLDCQLYGMNPAGHHFTNLLLHVCSTVVFFAAFLRLTRTAWRSAMVAALFALHPLHVESVAWIAERKDVLSTFFFALTLLTYGGYAQDSRNKALTSGFFWLAVLFFACGLMSKPMLVTLPFVLLLLDYWPLKRIQFSARNVQSSTVGKLVLEKIPFFILSVVTSVIAYHAQKQAGAVTTTYGFPVVNRLANALVSYFRYLRKMFWPDDLAVFYPHPGTWPVGQVFGAAILLAAISFFVIAGARRRPYLLTGWLWFLGMLVPVIGLVQVGMQSMADRYTYVPLIGIFIMLVWLAADVTESIPRRAALLWPAAVVILLACFFLSRAQLQHWKNSETLFLHALRVTKGNSVAHSGIGVIRFRQGKTNEAVAHFESAVRLRPDSAPVHNNLGSVLLAQGKLDEAVACLRHALEIDPNYPSAHDNLGLALARQGKTAEAEKHFAISLRINPNGPDAHNNRGSTEFQQGRIAEALSCFQAALRAKPDSAETHQNLGMTLAALGRTDEAIAEYREALRLDPKLAVVHNKLGTVLLGQGKVAEASSHFSEALRLQPDFADAHSNLGLILARQNKLDDAITHYRDALRSDSNHVVAHFNLGLSLIRLDRWEEAQTEFSTVLRLKRDHGEAHHQLGFALARKGKFAEACAHFEQALQHGAEPAEAHANLAKANSALGKTDVAIQHFHESIRLRPDHPEVLNDLAWILATHADARFRNGTEAVKLAKRAVELTQSKDAGKLDTLAAAYAEAGKFGEATKTAQQALIVAKSAGQTGLIEQVEVRLRSYEQSKPFHEQVREVPRITK